MSGAPKLPPGRDGLGEMLGIEHLEGSEGVARARIAVSERVLQPYGLVHGGAYSVLAETVCSKATAEAVIGEGRIAMGQSNNATFLRPISAGHLNATATARHRGRTSWVWEVEIADDAGRLCALVLVTVAVRRP
jgi:1,4-dihydroxy-2-naphthoyl-CoA hydrolase